MLKLKLIGMLNLVFLSCLSNAQTIWDAGECVVRAAQTAVVNPARAATQAVNCEALIPKRKNIVTQQIRLEILLLRDQKFNQVRTLAHQPMNRVRLVEILNNFVVPGGASRGNEYVSLGNDVGPHYQLYRMISSLINLATQLDICSSFGTGTPQAVSSAISTCAQTNPTLVASLVRDLENACGHDPRDNRREFCRKVRAFTEACTAGPVQSDTVLAQCFSDYIAHN